MVNDDKKHEDALDADSGNSDELSSTDGEPMEIDKELEDLGLEGDSDGVHEVNIGRQIADQMHPNEEVTEDEQKKDQR